MLTFRRLKSTRMWIRAAFSRFTRNTIQEGEAGANPQKGARRGEFHHRDTEDAKLRRARRLGLVDKEANCETAILGKGQPGCIGFVAHRQYFDSPSCPLRLCGEMSSCSHLREEARLDEQLWWC